MIVRKMTTEDLDEVVALEAAVFSMPWSHDGFLTALERDDALFVVAYDDGVLGYCGAYLTQDEAEITNVAVSPGVRRRGIGAALLDALTEELEQKGIFRIVLEVRESNDAARLLYEKKGFDIVGTRKNFYERPRENAYVMVREPINTYSE
ncbi:MAG: ribosomal protein S18-alanine N-acetyltransferase [bacterium]|nr:ribosomal protein S18-alanine N-acetyltransferase [bacterium]